MPNQSIITYLQNLPDYWEMPKQEEELQKIILNLEECFGDDISNDKSPQDDKLIPCLLYCNYGKKIKIHHKNGIFSSIEEFFSYITEEGSHILYAVSPNNTTICTFNLTIVSKGKTAQA